MYGVTDRAQTEDLTISQIVRLSLNVPVVWLGRCQLHLDGA
jgi:hypothetical protein